MASILDRYGIKEVFNFAWYNIDDSGQMGDLALVLSSLKVSNLEQTGEEVFAEGGHGNKRFIGWDYGRNITLALEDALFSPKSLAVSFGGTVSQTSTATITKAVNYVPASDGASYTAWVGPNGAIYSSLTNVEYFDGISTSAIATTSLISGTPYMVRFNIEGKNVKTIDVASNTFSGTYCGIGETLARNEKNGKDEHLQLIIPKFKVSLETALNLEAAGDAVVFNTNITVLEQEGSPMIKVLQYNL